MAILFPRWVDGGVSMAERILVVDDEYLVLELIRRSLEAANYEVTLVADGSAALQIFQKVQPHLVVLDLMMPIMSGWEVCSRLRALSTVPIIMLTALTGQEDIIKGLNAGADDYVVKPFQGKELLARVQAVLRRTRMPPPNKDLPLRFGGGDLVIDSSNRRVWAYGETVDLTRKEYDLLLFLAQSAGRILPAATIFKNVWSYKAKASLNSVKWYVWRLRNKIEKDPGNPHFIVTERGVGYRFVLL